MPVRFYYVLAFHEGITPLSSPGSQPHFLGKTSDLSFKTEPDKTLDLDDGSTEVGSEKLTLSFSILGTIDNPWPIGEVWLVPAISNGTYAVGEFPMGDVLRVFFRDSEDYHYETKSGEFELTRFSASIRYAVQAPAYDYYHDFFDDCRLHLFPNIISNEDEIMIKKKGDDAELAVAWSIDDRLIENQVALICSRVYDADVNVTVAGGRVQSLDPMQLGIFIHRI
jgi:hypothetical protein